ncbi:phospholipase [Actinomyces sp. B33]|uniref:phospholipase n=1 Tax=Actinomyces sp. B33 TaxID=2942131 RepID=UPI00233FBCCD|nr:phospholipase [Actinomyces sp. B33]MDC4233530.1 phospholipase [Actinomyces sp. B33]
MIRILAVVVWVAVTVYAVADWSRTPEEDSPGRLPKPLWLLVIILTIPMFSAGALAWISLRILASAEADGARGPIFGSRGTRPRPPARPTAPDDDPDFLFRLERDLQRRRREEAGRAANESNGPTGADADPAGPDRPAAPEGDEDGGSREG